MRDVPSQQRALMILLRYRVLRYYYSDLQGLIKVPGHAVHSKDDTNVTGG